MRTQKVPYLALTLFFQTSTTASALLIAPSLSLISPITNSMNVTKPVALPSELTSYPPGPPPNPFYYAIPDSDLTLELSALGLIRDRNEIAVKKVLSEATQASLDPYRPQVAIPEDGYQIQDGGFLLGVTPSAEIPGDEPLTWGGWTDVLAGIHGYVEAYPGYDFSFDIWLTPEIGQSEGYVVGAGFAITRRT